MKGEDLIDTIKKENPAALFPTGFEAAVIGIALRADVQVLVLSEERIIEILKTDMSEEEAYEYYSFNIEGAHMGNNDPYYVREVI
jgi:hypothetical protein